MVNSNKSFKSIYFPVTKIRNWRMRWIQSRLPGDGSQSNAVNSTHSVPKKLPHQSQLKKIQPPWKGRYILMYLAGWRLNLDAFDKDILGFWGSHNPKASSFLDHSHDFSRSHPSYGQRGMDALSSSYLARFDGGENFHKLFLLLIFSWFHLWIAGRGDRVTGAKLYIQETWSMNVVKIHLISF